MLGARTPQVLRGGAPVGIAANHSDAFGLEM